MAETAAPAQRSAAARLGPWWALLAVAVLAAAALAWAGTGRLVERTTESGLRYQMLRAGEGASPGPSDLVAVNYVGRLASDGKVFDSSYATGRPAQFRVSQVIPGMTEAVQLMRPGGKARVYIPSRLAYGPAGAGAVIPADADLIFDVELIAIAPPGMAPPAGPAGQPG
jgi:hypothetical protein